MTIYTQAWSWRDEWDALVQLLGDGVAIVLICGLACLVMLA